MKKLLAIFFIILSSISSTLSASAADIDLVDWKADLQIIDLAKADMKGVPAIRPVTTIGVNSKCHIAVGIGGKEVHLTHRFDPASATLLSVKPEDATQSFKTLPKESGQYRLTLEKGNKVQLCDRGISHQLRSGILWTPKAMGILDEKLALVSGMTGDVEVFAMSGIPLGTLHGFGSGEIVALAGAGNMLVALGSDGTVRIWDVSSYYELAEHRPAEVEITGVKEGYPAAKMKLDKFDRLIAINGVPVQSCADAMLTLRGKGTFVLTVSFLTKDPEKITITKDEGPFGLMIKHVTPVWNEETMPLAALAFGDNDSWVAWSGTWRLYRSAVERLIPVIAESRTPAIAEPYFVGSARLAGRLVAIDIGKEMPVAGLRENPALQETLQHLLSEHQSPAVPHVPFKQRFSSKLMSGYVQDSVTGFVWMNDIVWFSGNLAKVEKYARENKLRLATKNEALELSSYVHRAISRNDVWYGPGRSPAIVLETVFMMMRGAFWTATTAPNGNRYVCDIDYNDCAPASFDKNYGALLIRMPR